MKCNQCNNNAMYLVGDQKIPLCLNCYANFQQLNERKLQNLREEMNYTMDHVNSMFGTNLPKYPTKRPVVISGGTVNNNHIAINNSQIGVLNTGNIENLNQTIDCLYKASQKDLADQVKRFSESILTEKSLTDDQKTEVLENLDVVTKEILQEPQKRKKATVKLLTTRMTSLIGLTADSLAIWQILHPLIQKFFN